MGIKNFVQSSLKMFGAKEKDSQPDKLFAEQRRKLENGEEIEPPWIVFPDSSPIHGWNQGYQEAWKNEIWLPFWQKMNTVEREEYLNRWKVSDEWRETLTVYWNSD